MLRVEWRRRPLLVNCCPEVTQNYVQTTYIMAYIQTLASVGGMLLLFFIPGSQSSQIGIFWSSEDMLVARGAWKSRGRVYRTYRDRSLPVYYKEVKQGMYRSGAERHVIRAFRHVSHWSSFVFSLPSLSSNSSFLSSTLLLVQSTEQ